MGSTPKMDRLPPILREPLNKADQEQLKEMVVHMYNEHPETRSYVESWFVVDKSEVPKLHSKYLDSPWGSDAELSETDSSDSAPEKTIEAQEASANAASPGTPD
ncbi:hypothetical protein IWX90DRAFT_415329 [Phyllosticta citrichinensis]|uniref:Uncharacterized protein n=1 Tax=Phyllosticta citrichinensis TaxID=1130410 RepID=A0ABR1XV14_9PEZI